MGRSLGATKGQVWMRQVWLCLLVVAPSLASTAAPAAEIVFLQDGRAIQAERVEVLGDRVRIERPAETIELPRSQVLSIHRPSDPGPSPRSGAPAEVYRDMTRQMTERVRREMAGGPPGVGPR